MEHSWRAKAAEFHLRATEAGDSHVRDKFEMIALAYVKAADFGARADNEPNAYFREEFRRIAAGYARMASQCAVASPDADEPAHREARDS